MTRQRLKQLWANAPADVVIDAYFEELMEAVNDAKKLNKQSEQAYLKLQKENALLKLDIDNRDALILSIIRDRATVVNAVNAVLQWADEDGDFVEGPAVRRDVAACRELIAEKKVPTGGEENKA